MEELRKINPTSDDIVELMITALDRWVKKATIAVTIPEGITVKVDTRTGLGSTTQERTVRGELL